MSSQCKDNKSDRALGEFWEHRFCDLAVEFGKSAFMAQKDRSSAAAAIGPNKIELTPDIFIFQLDAEDHEVKHKNLLRGAKGYGYEEYRLTHLLNHQQKTGHRVYYTIHDHDLAGGRGLDENRTNRLGDWLTVEVRDLKGTHYKSFAGKTWYNGRAAERMILLWDWRLWQPLSRIWGVKEHWVRHGSQLQATHFEHKATGYKVPCYSGALKADMMPKHVELQPWASKETLDEFRALWEQEKHRLVAYERREAEWVEQQRAIQQSRYEETATQLSFTAEPRKPVQRPAAVPTDGSLLSVLAAHGCRPVRMHNGHVRLGDLTSCPSELVDRMRRELDSLALVLPEESEVREELERAGVYGEGALAAAWDRVFARVQQSLVAEAAE